MLYKLLAALFIFKRALKKTLPTSAFGAILDAMVVAVLPVIASFFYTHNENYPGYFK
jgi:hypothetical protein